jgi:hypothetical protein
VRRMPESGCGRRSVAGRRGGRGTHPGPAAPAPRAWCLAAPRTGVPGPCRAALGVPEGVTRPGSAGLRAGTGPHRSHTHERGSGDTRVQHTRKQGRPVMSQS